MSQEKVCKIKPCYHLLTALKQVLISRIPRNSNEGLEIYVCFDHKTQTWGVTDKKEKKARWATIAQAIEKYAKQYSPINAVPHAESTDEFPMEIYELKKTFMLTEYFFSEKSKLKFEAERESKPIFGRPFPSWGEISINDEITKLISKMHFVPRMTLTPASPLRGYSESPVASDPTCTNRLKPPSWDF